MLTIPTDEFTGGISDVAGMAWPDDTYPTLNVVRIEWDGHSLHFLATDRYRLGWTRWQPDDDPVSEKPVQEGLDCDWGSGDDPWAVSVPLADALHLAKTFALPAKEGRVPLEVDVRPGRITVRRRAGVSPHPAYLAEAETLVPPNWPDVPALLARTSTLDKVQTVAFTARFLADFAKVRGFGPMHMSFTGPAGLCLVQIGTRFTGAIQPVRLPGEDDEAADGDAARDRLLLKAAADVAATVGAVSVDMLAKRLRVSAGRAAALVDELAAAGVVGPDEGVGFRQALVGVDGLEELLDRLDHAEVDGQTSLDADEESTSDGGS